MAAARQKIGRNQRCPCGSGKKYKRCCALLGESGIIWHDELERVTEDAWRLTREGKFDEAEAACHELKRRWPDMIDWRDRFAILYEMRGDYALAAKHYQLAAEFAAANESFDQELIDEHRTKARELGARARREH
jgi:tetratricopeptide (TPR) repeat protein